MKEIGKYILLKIIGRGGMSIVYLARNSEDGTECAVKVLKGHEDVVKKKRMETRFKQEAQIIAELQHENLIKIHEYGIQKQGKYKGRHFIAMEYLRGDTLKDLLKKEKKLPPERATVILVKLAKALAYAHSVGIVHRDIKPANVLLSGNRVVLTDFGIAKDLYSDKDLTKTGSALGTPQYMSPEQITSKKEITPATDVFSLGVLFYELLTGSTPCKNLVDPIAIAKKIIEGNPPRLPKGIRNLQYLIDTMMANDVDDRIPDAEELIVVLEHSEETSGDDKTTGTFDSTNACYATEDSLFTKEIDPKLNSATKHAISYKAALKSNKEYGIIGEVGDGVKRLFRSIKTNSTIKVLFFGTAIFICIVLYLAFQDKPKYRFQVTAISGVTSVIKLLNKASIEIKLREGKYYERVFNILLEASSLEPDNSSIISDLRDITTLLINKHIINDELDQPKNNNALQKLEYLYKYSVQDSTLDSYRNKKAQIFTLLNKKIKEKDYITLQDRFKMLHYLVYLALVYDGDRSVSRELNTLVNKLKNKSLEFAKKGEYSKSEQIASRLYRETNNKSFLKLAIKKPLAITKKHGFIGAISFVKGGCFDAGSSVFSATHKENEKQHNVCLEDFSIGKHEVSIRQYLIFCKETGCKISEANKSLGISYPITKVSWEDAMAYTKWLGKKTGKNVSLPTEYQWEFVAKYGSSDNHFWQKGDAEKFANCADCGSLWGGKSPSPIGSFYPNKLDVHDILGNVWEWTCSDYKFSFQEQTKKCKNNTNIKVIRGGSWISSERSLNSSSRIGLRKDKKTIDLGFRIVINK